MLTPQGLKGKQFRITGTSYPRLGPPPRRRRRVLAVIGSVLALALIALGGVQLVDIFTGKAKHGATQACASAHPSAGATGKPMAAPANAASGSAPASPGASASASPSALGSPLPAVTAVPSPQAVTVNVLNSTDKAGLAAHTADELKKRGFIVGKVGNAPATLQKKVPGSAEVVGGQSGAAAAALLGAQVAGAATLDDGRTDGSVDFVIGDGFTALLDPNAAAAALADATKPSPTPSQVPGSC
ncbi:LytR C-terminal domain-containing protein [Kitasatospora sp. NPDC006697]|uniref:LytR C-terminal domain-containing protein n=1 Tax=Kitasatospora sp. NPDC006697 TaxID=3364020 RepID=UPI0036AAAC74